MSKELNACGKLWIAAGERLPDRPMTHYVGTTVRSPGAPQFRAPSILPPIGRLRSDYPCIVRPRRWRSGARRRDAREPRRCGGWGDETLDVGEGRGRGRGTWTNSERARGERGGGCRWRRGLWRKINDMGVTANCCMESATQIRLRTSCRFSEAREGMVES